MAKFFNDVKGVTREDVDMAIKDINTLFEAKDHIPLDLADDEVFDEIQGILDDNAIMDDDDLAVSTWTILKEVWGFARDMDSKGSDDDPVDGADDADTPPPADKPGKGKGAAKGAGKAEKASGKTGKGKGKDKAPADKAPADKASSAADTGADESSDDGDGEDGNGAVREPRKNLKLSERTARAQARAKKALEGTDAFDGRKSISRLTYNRIDALMQVLVDGETDVEDIYVAVDKLHHKETNKGRNIRATTSEIRRALTILHQGGFLVISPDYQSITVIVPPTPRFDK